MMSPSPSARKDQDFVAPAGKCGECSGRVYDIAYLGDMTTYYVADDGQIVRASILNAARIMDDPLTWSDRAWISFRPDAGVVLTSWGRSCRTLPLPPPLQPLRKALSRTASSGITSRLVIIVPYAWLLFSSSFPSSSSSRFRCRDAISMPPYAPSIDFSEGIAGLWAKTYRTQLRQLCLADGGSLYFNAYISSVMIAGVSAY